MEELLNNVNARLQVQFPESIVSAELLYDYPVFTIKSDQINDVLAFLKNDENLQFQFLTDLTGMQTADEKQLAVVYHLHNLPKNTRIRLKTFMPIDNPVVATATNLWPAANWMERETFDFFGIRFKGHPNLKRILNMDEMDVFPLRKDIPLEDQERTDKDNAFFGR